MKRLQTQILDLFVHEYCLETNALTYVNAANSIDINGNASVFAVVEPNDFSSLISFFVLLEHVCGWHYDFREISQVGRTFSKKDPRYKSMRLLYKCLFFIEPRRQSYYAILDSLGLKFFISLFSVGHGLQTSTSSILKSFKITDYQQFLMKTNKPFSRAVYFSLLYAEPVKEFNLKLNFSSPQNYLRWPLKLD